MKLQNKQTGEICPAEAREDGIYLYNETTEQWYKYELDLLASGWKYYKEPKGYWYYDTTSNSPEFVVSNEAKKLDKQIGNFFETKEEAEKAVEKLKAWKRLKDKGFRFRGWFWSEKYGTFTGFSYVDDDDDQNKKDLDLLFGGEE